MLRCSAFHVLAIFVAGGTAHAQTQPASPAPVTATAAATEASADAAKPTKKATPPPSALPPGMPIGAAGAEAGEDPFPLHANATLSNSFGNGLVAPIAPVPAYQPQPNWSTTLVLGGNAILPKLDFLPLMILNTGVSFSVNNWLSAFANGAVYDRLVRVSDISFGLAMPRVFTEDFTNINLGFNLSARLPTSITSRQQNLFTTLGASLPVNWTSPAAPWGQINANYVLVGRLSLYTQDAPTIPCDAAVSLAGVVANPLENGDLPVSYGREAEITSSGECVLRGRQGLASVSNNLSLSWFLAAHSVSASLGWSFGFLRPLAHRPDLRSQNASDQNFNENLGGSISYNYQVPVDFPLSISAGIGSSQSPYRVTNDPDKQELINPFFDFFTPANNYSAAFLDFTVGI